MASTASGRISDSAERGASFHEYVKPTPAVDSPSNGIEIIGPGRCGFVAYDEKRPFIGAIGSCKPGIILGVTFYENRTACLAYFTEAEQVGKFALLLFSRLEFLMEREELVSVTLSLRNLAEGSSVGGEIMIAIAMQLLNNEHGIKMSVPATAASYDNFLCLDAIRGGPSYLFDLSKLQEVPDASHSEDLTGPIDDVSLRY